MSRAYLAVQSKRTGEQKFVVGAKLYNSVRMNKVFLNL